MRTFFRLSCPFDLSFQVRRHISLLVTFVLFCGPPSSKCTLTILWPPELAGFRCESAQLYYKGIEYNFAPLNYTKLVFPSRSDFIQGALVFSDVYIPSQPVVRSYMQQGAIGVVFNASSDVPGRMMFATDGRDDSDITVPVVQIGPFSAMNVFTTFNGSYMIVNLTSDGNQWRNVYQSPAMIFGQVLVTATGIVVAALAIWKAVLFYRRYRFEYAIPLLCLLLDFFACVERSVYFAIDPRNIHEIFDKSIELALFYISIPFTLSVAILITFFWHDALVEHSVRVHGNILKLRVPFLITVISLYALQLITIILALLLYSSDLFLVYGINALLLIFFSVSCSIYYIVIATRVLKRLKRSPLRDQRPIKKLTGLVIASAIGLFLFAALTILGTMPSQDYPQPYVFWFCMLFISLNYIALTHIISFQLPKTTADKSHHLTEDNARSRSDQENTVPEDEKSQIAMVSLNHT